VKINHLISCVGTSGTRSLICHGGVKTEESISIKSPHTKSKLNLWSRTVLSLCKNSFTRAPQARLVLPSAPYPLPFFTLSFIFYFFCFLLNALTVFFLRRTQTTQLVFPLWGVHHPLTPTSTLLSRNLLVRSALTFFCLSWTHTFFSSR
jgi:hypothetical protein